MKTVFLTAFYASIIPIGIIFSCIGLIFNYWVSKYNVVNKRIFKNSYGYRLSIEMTENLELMLPIYCVNIKSYIFYSSLTFGLNIFSLMVQ